MVLEEDENEDTMSASYVSGEKQPLLFVHWKILLVSMIGLNVSEMSVTGEQYNPHKGVQNITKSGTFHVQCY